MSHMTPDVSYKLRWISGQFISTDTSAESFYFTDQYFKLLLHWVGGFSISFAVSNMPVNPKQMCMIDETNSPKRNLALFLLQTGLWPTFLDRAGVNSASTKRLEHLCASFNDCYF